MEGSPPPERPEEPAGPRRGAGGRAAGRRLRSLIPTSPLPWQWHARINRGLLAGIVLLFVLGAIASILIQRAGDDDEEEAQVPASNAAPEVQRALAEMSPKQKAEAVLIAGIADGSGAEATLRRQQLGGVLVGPAAWRADGRGLVRRLRAAAAAGGRVPALIVARQEGGTYRSYPDLPPPERELDVGNFASPQGAFDWASATGSALAAAGFDLNLGLLGDVATLDSPVADRAFGDDPQLVAQLTSSAVRGCRAGGLACAVAHFPGLGGASDDTRAGPATISLDEDSLRARDLLPFEAAIAAGAPAMTLSLAFYAAYDPVTPAALDPSVATGLLRDDLGYKGVAISDDLTAGAITAGLGPPEAAVQAIAAGTDMVLVDDPVQAERARVALLKAANSGGLSNARLDEAVARILELKRKLGLLPAAKKKP